TGVATNLASSTGPVFGTSEKYRVYCVCVGTTIASRIQRVSDSAWLKSDNTWQVAQQDYLTTTDVSITGAGKAGIGFTRFNGSDLLASDDFLFETVGSGPVASMRHPRLISVRNMGMSLS